MITPHHYSLPILRLSRILLLHFTQSLLVPLLKFSLCYSPPFLRATLLLSYRPPLPCSRSFLDSILHWRYFTSIERRSPITLVCTASNFLARVYGNDQTTRACLVSSHQPLTRVDVSITIPQAAAFPRQVLSAPAEEHVAAFPVRPLVPPEFLSAFSSVCSTAQIAAGRSC